MALTDDNRVVPITSSFDFEGDKCEREDAIGFICASDETGRIKERIDLR